MATEPLTPFTRLSKSPFPSQGASAWPRAGFGPQVRTPAARGASAMRPSLGAGAKAVREPSAAAMAAFTTGSGLSKSPFPSRSASAWPHAGFGPQVRTPAVRGASAMGHSFGAGAKAVREPSAAAMAAFTTGSGLSKSPFPSRSASAWPRAGFGPQAGRPAARGAPAMRPSLGAGAKAVREPSAAAMAAFTTGSGLSKSPFPSRSASAWPRADAQVRDLRLPIPARPGGAVATFNYVQPRSASSAPCAEGRPDGRDAAAPKRDWGEWAGLTGARPWCGRAQAGSGRMGGPHRRKALVRLRPSGVGANGRASPTQGLDAAAPKRDWGHRATSLQGSPMAPGQRRRVKPGRAASMLGDASVRAPLPATGGWWAGWSGRLGN